MAMGWWAVPAASVVIVSGQLSVESISVDAGLTVESIDSGDSLSAEGFSAMGDMSISVASFGDRGRY